MSKWSSDLVRLHAPLHDAVVAVQDGPERRRHHRIDIKELQRRAYERGVTTERERISNTVEKILSGVASDVRTSLERAESDRAGMEEFAVRLATVVAEKLVGRVLDEGSHDVVAMVRDVLEDIVEADRKQGVTVRLNPEDESTLRSAISDGTFSGEGLDIVGDPRLDRGSFAVVAGECELMADMTDRLEKLRGRLIEEAQRDSA